MRQCLLRCLASWGHFVRQPVLVRARLTRRLIALVMAILFSWDTVAWSAPEGIAGFRPKEAGPAELRAFIHGLSIPESFGRIVTRFLPASAAAGAPVII